MTVCFTLCSKNYLPHATALASSFRLHHPGDRFVIGLVDRLSASEAELVRGYEILKVDDLREPAIDDMKARYNVIELNTAVKPYYIDYFFRQLAAHKVIYLDPDVLLFDRLDHVVAALDTYSFVLTPHFMTPLYDQYFLREQLVLNTGTFNLGFFAARHDTVGKALIGWWRTKLYDECLMDQSRGYFMDQKWMNLSICHFDNYSIDKHPGLNVAHWNLHERTLTAAANGKYIVNGCAPLVFFHFSTYKPEQPAAIARTQNRFSFESRPDIVPLFKHYQEELMKHRYDELAGLTPVYGRPMPRYRPTLKNRVKSKLLRSLQKW